MVTDKAKVMAMVTEMEVDKAEEMVMAGTSESLPNNFSKSCYNKR